MLGIAAGIAGGLPPLRLPKRRERKPDPVAEAAAIAKRARKAAKRAEDERRTAEGRANAYPAPRSGYGYWDAPEGILAELAETTNWRIRSRERRALPGMERPWKITRRLTQGRVRALGPWMTLDELARKYL